MGDAPGPIPPALPLFSLPIDAPSRAENTKKQYTKCNAMFIAYLVDADISLFHEAYRNIFLGADQHDKLHPETAVSRANLLAFARHALANGMPIRLRELSHGIFTSYIAMQLPRSQAEIYFMERKGGRRCGYLLRHFAIFIPAPMKTCLMRCVPTFRRQLKAFIDIGSQTVEAVDGCSRGASRAANEMDCAWVVRPWRQWMDIAEVQTGQRTRWIVYRSTGL